MSNEKMARRKLMHGPFETAKYGFKPFGYGDFGYDDKFETIVSTSLFALIFYGSYTIDPVDSLIHLGSGFALNELFLRNTPYQFWSYGQGSSWVFNFQAGYLWYNYFVKKRRSTTLTVATYASIIGDMIPVIDEFRRDDSVSGVSNLAHAQGASMGMLLAWLMDRFWRKRKGGGGWKSYLIPLGVYSAMIAAQSYRIYKLQTVPLLRLSLEMQIPKLPGS